MDQVKLFLQRGSAILQKGKERELFQNNDEIEHPDVDTGAAKEWEEFVSRSTIYIVNSLQQELHANPFCSDG